MKGSIGTPMTTFRFRKRVGRQVADVTCPVCHRVANEPCRGKGKRGWLVNVHSQRAKIAGKVKRMPP